MSTIRRTATCRATTLGEQGRAVLDWIGDYLEHPEQFPVLSRAKPGEIRASLPSSPPREANRSTRFSPTFRSKIIPGITHWNHPSFFGYFATSSSVPGILAELLIAAIDVKAMLWKTSPAATELEEVVTDWLRQMLGLSGEWFGITTDTASISTMFAMAAAREARPELQIRERGMAGRTDLPRLRVYCSSHAHSSVDKGALALGHRARERRQDRRTMRIFACARMLSRRRLPTIARKDFCRFSAWRQSAQRA